MSKGNAKGRTVALASLGAALAIVGWLVLRPKQDLAIISDSPTGYRAVPKSQIAGKPFFDFKLAGRRFVYPDPNSVPSAFGALPGVSGVLVDESGRTDFATQGWLGNSSWRVGDSLIPCGPAFLNRNTDPDKIDLWCCPYVFGETVQKVELLVRPESERILLALPPMGKPEPKIAARTIPVGKYKLKLDPMPWISPSFPIRFKVSIEGGQPDDVFFMIFSEAMDGGSNLRFEAGKPAEFSLHNWSKTWGVLMQMQRVRAEKLQVSVSRQSLPGGVEKLKFLLADTPISELEWNMSDPEYTRENAFALGGYVAIRIGTYWPREGGEFGFSDPYGGPPIDRSQFAKYKDGDVIEAIAYKPIDPIIQQDFLLDLPDPKVIPGTRAFEPTPRG